jgi:hypothetical protein
MVPYTPPVVITTAQRDDGFSDPSTITLNGSMSSLSVAGTPKNAIVTMQYKFKKSTDANYPTSGTGSPVNFTAGTATFPAYKANDVVLTTQIVNTFAWDVSVTVTDKLGSTTVVKKIGVGQPVMFIDSVKKSVGINMFPVGNGTFEVGGTLTFPANRYGELGGAINLNNGDVLGGNNWFFGDATGANEGIHFPKPTTPSGSTTTADYDTLRVEDSVLYLNTTPLSVKPNGTALWSGGSYLNASTTITPTKKLSECANGWVLAFSDIDDLTVDVTNDQDLFMYIVPKRIALGTFAGNGHSVILPTSSSPFDVNNNLTITLKYIYIHDDKLVGASANDGDAFDRDVCLRFVYEF